MGLFCLVLHTHLPYVRRNGVWPAGEDFFHQAATESYLPLLASFNRLADAGLKDAFTLGMSPMVSHQMRDEHMTTELSWYLGQTELRTWRQAANYEGWMADDIRRLAGFYARRAREHGELLDDVGTVGDGFAALARAGLFEVLGGPATHPYMPLIREPAIADAQVRTGVDEHRRAFGGAPAGMWLPECAFAPARGIEDLLERNGVDHIVVDGPTMIRSAGKDAVARPARIGSSDVVAFARNLEVSYRVWSPTGGYPTGKWYRDFFHYDVEGGFKNWRVTSIHKPLSEKGPYEPERAEAAARADAEDFAATIERALAGAPDGVVVAAYDTELFGHWWFEGPAFLEHLFAVLARSSTVRACSLAEARRSLHDPQPVDLVEGSWGFRKDDRSWVADETGHMWETLGEVEGETVRLLDKHAGADQDLLAQLLRECMLLQASDWPFMVLRGRNADYANERFASHHARWQRCAELLQRNAPPAVMQREARELFAIDNILPALRPADVFG